MTDEEALATIMNDGRVTVEEEAPENKGFEVRRSFEYDSTTHLIWFTSLKVQWGILRCYSKSSSRNMQEVGYRSIVIQEMKRVKC